MATTYSVQKTKWDQTNPPLNIKPNELGGRVRTAYALYEAAALAVGVTEMFNLPNGARILSGELVHDALGASTTLAVGYEAYTNSAGTAVVAAAAAYKAAAASTAITTVGCMLTSALGKNSVVDADGTGLPITVTLAGAAATGTIELTVLYVVD
jgi:hypothetical protein